VDFSGFAVRDQRRSGLKDLSVTATDPLSLNFSIICLTVLRRGTRDSGNIYTEFCLTSSVHSPPKQKMCSTIKTQASSDSNILIALDRLRTVHRLAEQLIGGRQWSRLYTVTWCTHESEHEAFKSLPTSSICFLKSSQLIESLCILTG
jgi:hypothetical protein